MTFIGYVFVAVAVLGYGGIAAGLFWSGCKFWRLRR